MRTALYDLHVALGARMVEFAGYEMPVSYPLGILAEHLHVRAQAGLFDVSHMGQILLRDAAALEALVPVDLRTLPVGRQRYGFFTNETGGILDDLMIVNRGSDYLLVVNAGCKAADLAHLRAHLAADLIEDRALLALQGPAAEAVLARLVPQVSALKFMDYCEADWQGVGLWITRSGYTGEDGFEISLPEAHARGFAQALLAEPEVEMIGLGARDSLRLEAGMPLYGHDIDAHTSPVAAGLGFAISSRRRAEGGFLGAEPILRELADPSHRRVGLLPEGRAPMREGVELYSEISGGAPIGAISSGGFSPSLGRPIAMAILPANLPFGAVIYGELRGKRLPLTLAPLPFIQTNYKR